MASSSAEVARDKERRVFELRSAGVTFERIAKELGYRDRGAAHKAWQRALKRAEGESLDESKRLELARLDRLHQALWPAALKGDVSAVDRCLKIAERRSKLLGLDAPIGVQVPGAPTTGSSDPVDDLAARRAQRYAEA